MSLPFRCARASEDRTEGLAGTASTVRAFLLVEAPGPWGPDAVSGSVLPQRVKDRLAYLAQRHGVRSLLIRRHGRSVRGPTTVFAAFADPRRPWLETTRVEDPHDLLGLDLARLGSGLSPGLTPHHDPLFLVCTHGRHDVCCAERGRPVAAALSRHLPQHTWEVSHIGGDRFAGNMLVLPDGLYYGRLSPEIAVSVAARHREGHLDLPHLRGRCGYPFAVQAAEAFLRAELDRTGLADLSLSSRVRTGEETTALFDTDDGSWRVRVRSTRSPAERLTCRGPGASVALVHTLVAIVRA